MLKSHSPFRTMKPNEFLPPVSRWATWGGFALVGSVTALLALSAIIKHNVTVKAPAIIRPSGELRLVQTELEGTIDQIEAKVNQRVKRGDVIARLDQTQLDMQRRQLAESIQQGQIQLARMDAQIQLVAVQIAAESQSIDQSVSVAEAEFARSQQDYQTQQTTNQANLAEANAALEFAQREMQRYQQLANTGAISQLQLEEKQSAVRTAQAQVTRAQAALNPSAAPVTIAQRQITQAQSQGRATVATLNREQELLQQQRSEIQAQLIRDQKELQQVERNLERSVIRATADGVILQLNLRNANQVVQAGDAIAEIAPEVGALVVKASIATQDINRVQIGQTAQLRINACPYPDYGTLSGEVTAISPDAITPSNDPTADKTFEAILQPKQLELSKGNRSCRIRSGMEAEANIVFRQETYLQFILRKTRLMTGL